MNDSVPNNTALAPNQWWKGTFYTSLRLYLIIYIPFTIVYIFLYIFDQENVSSYATLSKTEAEFEQMARKPPYYASLMIFGALGVSKVIELISDAIRHVLRPTPWIGQDPDIYLIMRIFVMFILAYAWNVALGISALQDLTSDERQGLNFRFTDYAFNWLKIFCIQISWEMRVLMAPQVYCDIRIPIAIIASLGDIVLLNYIGLYACTCLFVIAALIDVSFMYSLCEYLDISFLDALRRCIRNVPKRTKGELYSPTDSDGSGREDCDNLENLSQEEFKKGRTQDRGQHDLLLLSDMKQKLNKFSGNFVNFEESNYLSTKEWLLEFICGFKRHNTRCTIAMQVIILVTFVVTLIIRLAFISSVAGWCAPILDLSPMEGHITRFSLVYSALYTLQLMYDINEGYLLQKIEEGMHNLRRETDVGINLLYRILPAHIVDKIIMDLSSARESDRRARREK